MVGFGSGASGSSLMRRYPLVVDDDGQVRLGNWPAPSAEFLC